MINCFIYTYKTLKRAGYDLPRDFNGYSMDDKKRILLDHDKILEEGIHIEYFDSFCTRVDEIQRNDIVVVDSGIGVAIDKFNYVSIFQNGNKTMRQISPDALIFRVGKEKAIAEDEEE